METNTIYSFEWKNLGDLSPGRPNPGANTHIAFKYKNFIILRILL